MTKIILGEGKVFRTFYVNPKTLFPTVSFINRELTEEENARYDELTDSLPDDTISIEFKSSAGMKAHIDLMISYHDYLVKYEKFLIVQEEYNKLLDDYNNGLSETEKYKVQYEKYSILYDDYIKLLNNAEE
jgi:hypothetical protein